MYWLAASLSIQRYARAIKYFYGSYKWWWMEEEVWIFTPHLWFNCQSVYCLFFRKENRWLCHSVCINCWVCLLYAVNGNDNNSICLMRKTLLRSQNCSFHERDCLSILKLFSSDIIWHIYTKVSTTEIPVTMWYVKRKTEKGTWHFFSVHLQCYSLNTVWLMCLHTL